MTFTAEAKCELSLCLLGLCEATCTQQEALPRQQGIGAAFERETSDTGQSQNACSDLALPCPNWYDPWLQELLGLPDFQFQHLETGTAW